MNLFSQAEFHNALQLSVDTPLLATGSILSNPEVLSLSFHEKKPSHDERWQFFEKITEGSWKQIDKTFLYQIPIGAFDFEELTQFLMITRLRKENMLKIAELHPEYKKYVEKVFKLPAQSANSNILTLEQAKKKIIDSLNQKNITLQKLSHQTGLSMVSLSNFKSGKDIRLSNFLKIARALGLGVKVD